MINLAWILALCAAAAAQDRHGDPAATEVTAKTVDAIAKTLDRMASRQIRDGSFGGSVPLATTSLACLAFLGSGSTPQAGPYATNIRRGLQYVRKCCTRSGFITDLGVSGMYGHGYATLLLAEAVGMLHDPEEIQATREALSSAVALLERAQNCYGGWNATPDGAATDDGSGAIAIMQITALRAARNSGIQVHLQTIEKARKYLLEMASNDGWYAYNYGMRGTPQHSSATTGAGMYMLGVLDLHSNAKYEKGICNLLKNAPFLANSPQGDMGWSNWWHYTCFYASLAIFQHGGDEWAKWYPAMRDHLIKTQSPDGLWPQDPYGSLYSCFAVLSLELPLRYLPIFQDGGRGREGR
jgi:hypothetical protein